jgi:cytochrome c biogenesis protein CcmG/thiol:disulfide interchange protein DsbE
VRRVGRWLIPILAIPAIGLLAFGLTRDVQVLPSAIVGEPAPDFRLATMSGDSLALDDLAGEVVILNFWASWCIPCRQEHPALVRATEAYDPGKVRVLGVLYQDEPGNAGRFMERFGGEWETVLDPGSRTAIDFGVYGVPETFFLNADGQIAYKHIGPLHWGIIESKVDSILAGGGTNAP